MQTDPRCNVPDETLVELIEKYGTREAAKRIGRTERAIQYRRLTIEKKIGRTINHPNEVHPSVKYRPRVAHPHEIHLTVANGVVLIASDAHIWPGPMSTAMRAFIRFCHNMKPAAVILNGDVMDFPKISRHPPIGWEDQPSVISEIEAAQEQLGQIEQATFKAQKIWTLGNHDARFETSLASRAPEYAKVNGVHLRDHFPLWQPCWLAWINGTVAIKHRFKNGMHATQNNTLWSGVTTVTGHLHSQRITPLTDYNGTRWGVDSGCLADTESKAFVDYTEGNPKNWRAGFCVLTFVDGQLLPPELVTVWDSSRVVFRGRLIEVPNEAKKAPRQTAPAVRPSRARAKAGRRRRA